MTTSASAAECTDSVTFTLCIRAHPSVGWLAEVWGQHVEY